MSGQHCAGGRGEGGGDVLPRFGILENSPKTVKCVINFATDGRHTHSDGWPILMKWKYSVPVKHPVYQNEIVRLHTKSVSLVRVSNKISLRFMTDISYVWLPIMSNCSLANLRKTYALGFYKALV